MWRWAWKLLKDMGESDPDKIQDETIREQVLYFKRGEGKKELTERIEYEKDN